jgi:hypothetical protein
MRLPPWLPAAARVQCRNNAESGGGRPAPRPLSRRSPSTAHHREVRRKMPDRAEVSMCYRLEQLAQQRARDEERARQPEQQAAVRETPETRKETAEPRPEKIAEVELEAD